MLLRSPLSQLLAPKLNKILNQHYTKAAKLVGRRARMVKPKKKLLSKKEVVRRRQAGYNKWKREQIATGNWPVKRGKRRGKPGPKPNAENQTPTTSDYGSDLISTIMDTIVTVKSLRKQMIEKLVGE